MKNLLHIIISNFHWIFFLVLICIAGWLLINNDELQRSRYLDISQDVAGKMHTVSGTIRSYLHLKRDNAALTERIAILEQELLQYKYQIRENNFTTIKYDSSSVLNTSHWRFFAARLVHNSISGTENYITLDKGIADGIREDMGVVSAEGAVVGLVMSVSSNFSRVIPLLNPNSRLSCKIKSSNFFGSLIWDGHDSRYSNLGELPSHTVYKMGDTIVTSGFSATFPEGVPVGIITNAVRQKAGNSNLLQIKLLTDFSTLHEVLIIENLQKKERNELEKGVDQ
ncbi:MAG: rod shape-determining protein MreC [Dysgonamonadaceae bacterium]|jgi:rod shape-determining protein MreC|nr:rod shape-determining protein MreC [Dysgonamonadaceae bacterium]